MENLATYYFSSVFEFSPNFFNFWKVGKFCWKITIFSQIFHQKQISQNRENFATNKKKKPTEITGKKLGTILSPTYIYGDVPTWKTSEQALWKGPPEKGLALPEPTPTLLQYNICVNQWQGFFFKISPNFGGLAIIQIWRQVRDKKVSKFTNPLTYIFGEQLKPIA